jgi:protein-L-isoaspartate(D-aspartate) O-methyltransferase
MEKLVNSLDINHEQVRKVLKSVDRGQFCRGEPYKDRPQSLGHPGATISAPHMHTYALDKAFEHLRSLPTSASVNILDVGSGSGYLTVCFERLLEFLNANGKVVGIERIKGVYEKSLENVKGSGVTIIHGDGFNGYPQLSPYNFIHVGATCEDTPAELYRQLAPGGMLLFPKNIDALNTVMTMVIKPIDNTVAPVERQDISVKFVPMIHDTT